MIELSVEKKVEFMVEVDWKEREGYSVSPDKLV